MAQFNLELCSCVVVLAVFLPLASGACVDFDLGMGSGTIPNSDITASSEQSASTPAINGRLNYTSGSSWCARTSDTNSYLQIDLQALYIICAVSTQGNSDEDQWVKNYTLQFSTNGKTWTDYKESGKTKFLRGNDDRNSEKKHVVYGVLAKQLRFRPRTHQAGVCMRTEVFGVEKNPTCEMEAIGLASGGTIPDSSFSASSHFNNKYLPSYGRLNENKRGWAPRTNSNPSDYLQIDLLYEYVICAVATQGANGINEWTKNYEIQLSVDGTTMVTYQENNADRVFLGNSNRNGIVKNSLQEFASAKFIRFKPTAYNSFKALRVEVYGILLTKVPSQPPAAFKLTASSSTSITASWQLPPVFARHGRNITGFKLFYKKKGSGGSATTLTISKGSTLSRNVTWLDKYTEYEFKVLAFTSDGDGPKSAVEVERTKEDAPSQAPRNFDATAVTSTIITASWQLPPADSRNGVIIGFKLFYQKRGSAGLATTLTINNGTALRRDVTGLNIYTEYEFEVLAFTSVGDGPRSSPVVVVRTMKDGCVEFSLGMENGRIPDSGITASSSSPLAKNARLNYASESSWCAGTSDTNPYLQIDLQTLHIICAVSTQGNSQADQWVKSYTLQLSTDGTTWKDYKEAGQIKTLTGNTDRNSEVKHVVYGILTRFLRFLPRTSQGGMCMRTEVFGVKKNPTCEMEAIGLAFGGTIPDSSFSASSHYDHRYKPSYGRLNRNSRGWAPKTKFDPADYLQIDFLYEYVICAVATQGANGINEWTKNYEIQLSVDGTTVVTYQENSVDRVFPGNSNQNGIVKNSLQEFASAKFIRFQPTSYNSFKALRVEVHGILLTKVPSQPPTTFKLTASSSTSITASWRLPPVFARHGRNITGFKLFYKKKGCGASETNLTINSTSMLSRNVTGLNKFTEYGFQVLAYTPDGDGPKSPVEVKRTKEDAPSAPVSLSSVDVSPRNSHGPRITLTWIEPAEPNGVIRSYTLFYSQNGGAAREISGIDKDAFSHTVDVFGGVTYQFNVTAVTIKLGPYETITVTTRTYAPRAPVPHNVSDVEVSETAVDIFLWPIEQINGPISAYQAIVLKVVNGVEELPENYDSQLKAASDAKNGDVNFYIAAEIGNVPVLKGPWKFTVGDGEKTGKYLNKELEKGQNYTVYERALTKTTKEVLKGEVGIVAKISITPAITGGRKENSSGFNVVAVAVPAVLLLLLTPAVVVAVLLYRRRRQTRSQTANERPVQFHDLQNDYENLGANASSLVYQNVGDSRRSIEGIEQQPDGEEEEATYSEADDGRPKPIPVANFAKYFKKSSENGVIVLRQEYKNLQGDMLFPCEISKSNRSKNRYGNIVSYDHSRVVLEEIEGDKNSSYINASYIPTYDEVTMTYIATQGPISTTVDDFWRLVWQENCSTIVMLTNLVEGGKGKCDQYWPDHTSKYGAFTVTLQKTETFADYVIRSLIVTKDSEKRNVHQFHYVTWPDKGVPQHSTALLGFRQKIHARHQATGGPLLVHCSAGVGRTGAYIAIDAMLESAEKIKTVFIQNYVQVMRRSRPYMVQEDEQYVFLHQAVMEALVCGNTEIIPQDLRIVMNKLSMVHKPSKKTGYEREFKRLELVTNSQASQEEAKEAFLPENAVKNRFPNTVPLDNARVHLQASSQEESYINASYVDDYRERNAYILTQAPLENTIKDFWLMISLYNIGTVVMLNNLKEGRQSYPKYWPSEGSARYDVVTVQLLSQETSNNITTRRFTLENAASHDRKSTIQHIQYTGWADGNSCPDPKEILELMNAVQQSQQQSGNGVIVFQCSDGIGRSGCVATIISVIERVKIEQTVDVFQTVKLVRAKRPGAVNTLEQYMFCYKTVLAYLDSFSTYSNFSEC